MTPLQPGSRICGPTLPPGDGNCTAVLDAAQVAITHPFGRPPHDGLPHYERYDWGMTGAEWRALAAA